MNAKRTKGGTNSPAAIAMRDFTIVKQRHELGWSWREIAEFHGMSERGVRIAERRTLDALPDLMNMDPVAIVEGILREYLLSVRTFDQLAAVYARDNPNATIGALKSANEAREKVTALLQATNKLPKELGVLRHLIDIRQIGVQMFETMEQFQARVDAVGERLPKAARAELEEGRREVEESFKGLMGIENE